jgi:hypothetical protein
MGPKGANVQMITAGDVMNAFTKAAAGAIVRRFARAAIVAATISTVGAAQAQDDAGTDTRDWTIKVPLSDFLTHCNADKTWCTKQIADVNAYVVEDEERHFRSGLDRISCSTDPLSADDVKAIVNWLNDNGNILSPDVQADADVAIMSAIQFLWPCH